MYCIYKYFLHVVWKPSGPENRLRSTDHPATTQSREASVAFKRASRRRGRRAKLALAARARGEERDVLALLAAAQYGRARAGRLGIGGRVGRGGGRGGRGGGAAGGGSGRDGGAAERGRAGAADRGGGADRRVRRRLAQPAARRNAGRRRDVVATSARRRTRRTSCARSARDVSLRVKRKTH